MIRDDTWVIGQPDARQIVFEKLLLMCVYLCFEHLGRSASAKNLALRLCSGKIYKSKFENAISKVSFRIAIKLFECCPSVSKKVAAKKWPSLRLKRCSFFTYLTP